MLRACAVEVHMDDVESHECTVNSSELARFSDLSTRCFSTTVRTPQCAHTGWGKKMIFTWENLFHFTNLRFEQLLATGPTIF